MNEHISFPKIRHFKDFISEIQYDNKDRQLISITGTIKLHGSHADIVSANHNKFYCQSRNRIITKENDNCGFASFIDERKKIIETLINDIRIKTNSKLEDKIFINGEICGGIIQKNIALQQLPKMFVIFNVKINSKWVDDISIFNIEDDTNKIYSILRAPTYNLIIDTDNLYEANRNIDTITDNVDKCCPFAKTFNIIGIGEGIVWKCTDIKYQSSRYWFKSKGQTHTEYRKIVRDKNWLKEEDNNVDFVNSVLTEARYNKGIDYLKANGFDVIISNIKYFVIYLYEDILDECKNDIIENDLSKEKLKILISKSGFQWYKLHIS